MKPKSMANAQVKTTFRTGPRAEDAQIELRTPAETLLSNRPDECSGPTTHGLSAAKNPQLHNATSPSSPSIPRPRPLLEFSTHELDSFRNSLKPPTLLQHHETNNQHDFPKNPPDLSASSPQSSPIDNEVDTLPLWIDRAFDTFLWSIPFMTVFVCLDVAIHAQYGQPVTIWSELVRTANVYPSGLFLIHYSLHYHEQVLANLLLFGLSTIGGSYMVYIMNRLSYLLVMRRVPPLGALWIYSVVRMHLSHAVFSLLLVALWAWIMNLSIYV